MEVAHWGSSGMISIIVFLNSARCSGRANGTPQRGTAVGSLDLPVEQDIHFTPTRTLSAYTALAREHRRIVT